MAFVLVSSSRCDAGVYVGMLPVMYNSKRRDSRAIVSLSFLIFISCGDIGGASIVYLCCIGAINPQTLTCCCKRAADSGFHTNSLKWFNKIYNKPRALSNHKRGATDPAHVFPSAQ